MKSTKKQLEYAKKYRESHHDYVDNYRKNYYKDNKDSINAWKKEWYKRNKLEVEEKRKIYYKKNKENIRNQKATKYGISIEEYKNLVEKQNNLCAICGNEETNKLNGIVKNLAIDHCHNSGKVRGLLCSRCNFLLGLSKDDIELFEKSIEYLKINNL